MNMSLFQLAARSAPARLGVGRILWDGGEHCVCELLARLHLTQSRMTWPMQVLRGAGIMSTPGVSINGRVVHSGGLPEAARVEGWLGAG